MKEDRLTTLRKYSVDELQFFLSTRHSDTITQDMQTYILQLDSVARLIHYNKLSVKNAIEQLRREWSELTIAQARSIYYDALDYYYFDDSSSAKSWDMVYADQLEDLRTIAIAANKFDVAYKCIVKAHELRTTVRESETHNWQAPVFLININVKPEDLGYESRKLADIAKRAEDRKYKDMIMGLETTDKEKERLLLEAGISLEPDDQTPKEMEYEL
ncbi:MAG: hypothetical protein ACI3ZQ_04955 [Candidatus Cryptobacteroides sp.]